MSSACSTARLAHFKLPVSNSSGSDCANTQISDMNVASLRHVEVARLRRRRTAASRVASTIVVYDKTPTTIAQLSFFRTTTRKHDRFSTKRLEGT